MGDSYVSLAASLCELIQSQVEELEALEEVIAAEDAAAAGGSGTLTSTPVSTKAAVPSLEGLSSSDIAGGGMFCTDTFFDNNVVVDSFKVDQQSAPVQRVAFLSGSADGFEDFGNGSEDGDVTVLANAMDKTNVEKMLAGSVKASTLAKYSLLWDKWLVFSAFHEVDTMPPHACLGDIYFRHRRIVRLRWGDKLHSGVRGPLLRARGVTITVRLAQVLQDHEGLKIVVWKGGPL
jgi:hypothetical protein